MSIDGARTGTGEPVDRDEFRLTPTSYLVLGLLAREGPSTPYELERHVRATLGNFWSFPHTLLYSEPARLARLGLVNEVRETTGRRRRIFATTTAGEVALRAWLDRPSNEPTELRDPGLLQLFFGDLAPAESRLRLAEQQLAIHQAKLMAYQQDQRLEGRPRMSDRGQRTVEHWRGETLPMGIAYEVGAVSFWADVAARARAALGEDARPSDVGPSAAGQGVNADG
jgi:PadR family transcriptional regulator, regulatory protein AphA